MNKKNRGVIKLKEENKNKELIIKALVDPKFRQELKENPIRALGVKSLTEINKKEINFVFATVKGIESMITRMADELLCANGNGNTPV